MISLNASILTPNNRYRSIAVLAKDDYVLNEDLKPSRILDIDHGEKTFLKALRYVIDRKITSVSLSPDVMVMVSRGFCYVEDMALNEEIIVFDKGRLEKRTVLSILNSKMPVYNSWLYTSTETFIVNGIIVKK